jgi:nucleotide-binding universal stress UspA family protein
MKVTTMSLVKTNSIVVVPWDFSDHSRVALDKALELTQDASQIRVVHVAPMPMLAGPGMLASSTDEDALQNNSESRFRECVAMDPLCQGISFTTLINNEQGHTICDFARDHDADLIVISSHGRTGITRLAIGSVAERIIRYASCPVLVLRANS